MPEELQHMNNPAISTPKKHQQQPKQLFVFETTTTSEPIKMSCIEGH